MAKQRLTETHSWDEIVQKIMDDNDNHKPSFKKWLISKKTLGGFFFNSSLYMKGYNIQYSINNDDRDHFVVCAGGEGVGKSTLAIQLACTLSPNFKLENICFNRLQLINGIINSEKGDVFVLDEGNLFLFSRDAMSGGNKFMLKLFALMRQKNLCLIICVPNFFTLDTYVRDHRVDTLIYINKKGTFTSYHKRCIPIISRVGFKNKSIASVRVPHGTFFNGYYNKFFPTLNDITVESYKKHKSDEFDIFLKEMKRDIEDMEGKSNFMSLSDANKIINLDRRTFISLIEKKQIEGKKIAGKWFVNRESLMVYGNV